MVRARIVAIRGESRGFLFSISASTASMISFFCAAESQPH